VAYETANFLEKNRDTLAEDLVALLNDSKLPLVKALFPLSEVDTQSSGRQAKSPTVGTNFKAQLAELMATLGATAPHYVRCIKPNTMKAPGTAQFKASFPRSCPILRSSIDSPMVVHSDVR
jgi:myosin heavy subunit